MLDKSKIPNLKAELVKERDYKIIDLKKPDELLERAFTEAGITSVANTCGIPAGYLNKVYEKDRDLFRANVRYWAQVAEITAKHKVITKGDMVAGICKMSHELISAEEILGKVEDLFEKEHWEGEVVQMVVSPRDTFLNVVFKDVEKNAGTAEVGDLLNAGFSLSHSMLGEYIDKMEAFVNRLACTNQMTVHDSRYGWKKDLSEGYSNYFQVLNSYVEHAYETGEDVLSRFISMQSIKVEDPIAAINSTATKMGVGARATNTILSTLSDPKVKVENMYDVINLFTYYATHVVEDPYVGRGMQRRAGEMMSVTVCDNCHQVVKQMKSSDN